MARKVDWWRAALICFGVTIYGLIVWGLLSAHFRHAPTKPPVVKTVPTIEQRVDALEQRMKVLEDSK